MFYLCAYWHELLLLNCRLPLCLFSIIYPLLTDILIWQQPPHSVMQLTSTRLRPRFSIMFMRIIVMISNLSCVWRFCLLLSNAF